MKTKRLALFVIVLLVLSLITACTNVNPEGTTVPTNSPTEASTSQITSEPTQGLLTPAGEYPIVNEPVTLDMFIVQPAWIEDYETNEFSLYLEDLMGIDLEFVVAPVDSYKEKMNLLLTSGNYPGIFYYYSPDTERYGVEEGILMDLTTLIDEQMPNLSSLLAENPDVVGQSTASDGSIYSLPRVSVTYHMTFSCKMWGNTMWLDEMGVDAPKTTDEFYNVCKQYLELNPDGVSLAGGSIPRGDPTMFLISAFSYYPYGDGKDYGLRLHNDDTIDSVFTDDGYKEALKYMSMLYKEGIFYEGNFTMSAEQVKALVASEGEPVLFIPVHWSGSFVDSTANQELYSHYYPIEPLTGPNGAQYTPNLPISSSPCFAITDVCEYPEVAVRFADYFYTMEAVLNTVYGMEGDAWRFAEAGEVGLNGEPAKYKLIGAYSLEPQNKIWTSRGINWTDVSFALWGATDPNVDIFDPNNLEAMLYKATKELYEPHYQETYKSLSRINLTLAESEEIKTIAVEVKNYIDQSKVDFITGARDIDTEWEAYVQALDDIGINTLISVYQTAYDRQYK